MNHNNYRLPAYYLTIIFLVLLLHGCNKEPDTSRNESTSVSNKANKAAIQQFIPVGASLPLSGSIASYGQRARNGVELAIEHLGKNNSAKIKVNYEDNQGKTAVAVAATQKLIDLNKVVAVIGSASSSVTMAMTNIGNQRKVVIISPISSSPELTTEGGPFFFRLAPSDTAQAIIMADWFKEEGISKIAVLYFANTWGQGLYEAVKTRFVELGGKIVATDSIQEGHLDFRTQIEKFKNSGAEAYYVITHGKEGGVFAKQARQLGVDVPLYGGDVWSSPEFVNVGGSAVEGSRLVAPAKLFGSVYDNFNNAYKKKFGEDPDVYAAYSYDIAMILNNAVLAGAKNGESVRAYFADMSPFKGASGTVQFDQNGDVLAGSFSRFEIKNGKPNLIN